LASGIPVHVLQYITIKHTDVISMSGEGNSNNWNKRR